MAIERPPLLCLGGEEAFDAYRKEFDRLYRSDPVIDVLGQQVLFFNMSCEHVCKKEHDDDFYKTGPRGMWKQPRAKRIPWIYPALTDPRTEVRRQRDTGNLQYVCIFDGEHVSEAQEPYVVIASESGVKKVFFITGFPLTNQEGKPDWEGLKKLRRKGPVIWRPKK